MSVCALYGCSTNTRDCKESGIHFFKFPKDKKLAKQWLDLCKRKDKVNVKLDYVCSNHFCEDDYENLLENKRMKTSLRLKTGAVPSKNLPTLNTLPEEKQTHVSARKLRAIKRQKLDVKTLAMNECDTQIESDQHCDQDSATPQMPVTLCTSEQLGIENQLLKSEIGLLKSANNQLSIENTELRSGMKLFEEMFTPGQFKRILNPNQHTHWEQEDITAAITLKSFSSKCYKYLCEVKKFPLPAEITLSDWLKDLDFEPGILSWVLQLMGKFGEHLSPNERLVALTFDEVYINNKADIDKKEEKIWGPHKSCLVIMCRGLFGKWKQPVFYGFDVHINKCLLFEIINQLYRQNFIVTSVTCDLSPYNFLLWQELNIGHDQNCHSCFCVHPANDNYKIFFFADVPHLLKLARNNLLDSGFLLDGILIEKYFLEKSITFKKNDLYPPDKITSKHFHCKGSARQDVSLAATLFSKSVASYLSFLGEQGFIKETDKLKVAVKIISIFNNWFDLFNSYAFCDYHSGALCYAYGANLTEQLHILDEMNKLITNIKVGKMQILPFQKGILLNNCSLVQLFSFLKNEFSVEYILTYRLNQDVLENFFSIMWNMGSNFDHPHALNMKSHIKRFLLGKYSNMLINDGNTSDRNGGDCKSESTTFLIKAHLHKINNEPTITETLLTDFVDKDNKNNTESGDSFDLDFGRIRFIDSVSLPELELDDYAEIPDRESDLLLLLEKNNFCDKIKQEALLYFAAYVAFKVKDKFPEYGLKTKKLPRNFISGDWLIVILNGNLLYPTKELQTALFITNNEFEKFHEITLNKNGMCISTVTKLAENAIPENQKIPTEIIREFVEVRTYFRIREVNKKISKINEHQEEKVRK